MSSRESNRDDDDSKKTDNLAELWLELLQLRRKVRQAETLKKKDSGRLRSDRN
jgi:hypothetical protein